MGSGIGTLLHGNGNMGVYVVLLVVWITNTPRGLSTEYGGTEELEGIVLWEDCILQRA